MLLEAAIFVCVALWLFLGKLQVQVKGKGWDFQCLKQSSYLFRYAQIFLVMLKKAPKIQVQRQSEYPSIATALDWIHVPKESSQLSSRLLIIIPGLTGHTHDNYVSETVTRLMPDYTHVCVYRYALVSKVPKQGRIDIMQNIKTVVEDLASQYQVIHAVGFSYGANQLLYYIGSAGSNCKIQKAAIVSNPFNIKKCSNLLPRLEDRGLTRLIRASAGRQRELFSSYDIDWNAVSQSQKLTDFDREFTIKLYGFPTVDDYYVNLSSARFVEGVTIPTLSISSTDDTISNIQAIPFCDCITYLITNLGGHNAFLDWRMRFWFLEPVVEFLRGTS